jgi:hypothetical protein
VKTRSSDKSNESIDHISVLDYTVQHIGIPDWEWGAELTMIKAEEIYTACKTFLQPFPASLLTPPFLVIWWNLPIIVKKNAKVTTCVANPATKTSVPVCSVLPCQLNELAIPLPDTWTKKEKISQVMKIRVRFRTGIRWMCVMEGGRTLMQRREMRR